MDGVIQLGRVHYGLAAEDICCLRLMERYILRSRTVGTYIDVGAYRPIEASNTHLFYERGWRGICVEPNPDYIDEFRRLRPEDEVLNIALADVARVMDYHRFDVPVLNGFLPDWGVQQHIGSGYRYLGATRVHCIDVPSFLERVPFEIDLLNLDVETFELPILRAWDWAAKRPKAICVEINAMTIMDAVQHPTAQHLYSTAYHMMARVDQTSIFVDDAYL